MKYAHLDEATTTGKEYLDHIKDDAVHSLGFFLKPSDLFRSLAAKGNAKTAQSDNDDESESKYDYFFFCWGNDDEKDNDGEGNKN